MMDDVALVDHHCHGVATNELDRVAIEALMSESYQPAAPGTNHFQKPLGLAIRRHCAPLLDLPPLCPADDYLARRMSLGSREVNRRFLSASNVKMHLLDTGHRSSEISDPQAFGALSGHPVREILRIEATAERVAASGCSAEAFPHALADALYASSADAVGFKSIVAYRTTFKIDQTMPGRADVVAAAATWLQQSSGRRPRLTDPTIVRHGLWTAADICRQRRLPLQLHVGFGDPDVYMHACDPTHFTDFLKSMETWRVPVTLLHNYPFVREAGWLAEIFQNVYYDVGAILNFTGPSCSRVMREALELGPFSKQLFSSDAFGLAELHYLGVVQFRRALCETLDAWIGAGDCSARDAEQIFQAIASDNAARIYPISDDGVILATPSSS
jgi:predicted TIM-barrel fold metal-dependent hydrolase